ncbi:MULTISPECIES: Cro/CI family transcriptional regulator [Enterobacter]|uniref:Cro/CI family transcriptional regulator n=1 Tax=Enterobacter TaxID=547 RepID=UPI0021D2F422|nr:Cro/CI family transcriptional regulator [Enterobacter bugandensis]MCU6214470.1 transcriptional regulator [Enterobacter bugandensis]HDS4354349.1 transcriptional regulator [Enterobacter roggenkampii]
MLKRDVVNFFGNNTAVARIVGVNRSAVSQWKTLVPERCAQRLADASNGALVYDPMVYDKHKQSKKDGLKNENQTVS